MSDTLLEKVIISTEIGNPAGSGLLSTQQSDRFLDYMFDATVLGPQVRKIRMRSNEIDVDRIGVGEHLLRGAVEAVDTGENQGVFFSKISMTTKKLRLDWEISTETLEDNIEGADLEDHIARLMATQVGNDLEDLAVNGDTTSSDKTLKVFDGWRKLAVSGNAEGAAHIVDAGGAGVSRATFNKALRAYPRKYLQKRQDLRWFTSSAVIQDYIYSLTTDAMYAESIGSSIIQNGPVRTQGPAGFQTGVAFGIPIQEVPVFSSSRTGSYSGATGSTHSDIWLTFPQNLLWGIKREITVYREFKPKKDTVEHTLFLRSGVQVENNDSFVVITNVKLAA